MKQFIRQDQIKELSKEEYKRLQEILNLKSDIDSHIISIGRMIEILQNSQFSKVMIMDNQVTFVECGGGVTPEHQSHKELCDNLWEAVKEVL